MPQWEHMDPRYVDHPWWGVVGWLVPVLLLVLLVGVALWLVARSTRPTAVAAPAPTPAFATAQPPSAPDPALERIRIRYAQGEIGRDEFVRMTRDLGGAEPPAIEPPTASTEVGDDA